ncbi:MAG: MFS transporter [Alphaproteobacteria bacterium]|nr:MAG: MFS transporter [Alphaproteobacteria bacterium]
MQFDRSMVRFLAFGLAVAFLSSFGQTYFLGIYKTVVSETFGFDHADFGLFYLVVTLGSAIGLNRLGHLIDGIPLRRYMTGLVCLLAFACFGMAVSGPLATVFLAFLALRLLGQGMMTHAAMTSMSRYFGRNRGRAVAIAALGFPLGQAILPPLAVLVLTMTAWRASWAVFGAGLLLLGLPLVLWLLKGHDARHARWLEDEAAASAALADKPAGKSWRRADVLKDRRFYLILPFLMASPFWVTAVFFFAEEMAAAKGWSLQAYTGFYWLFAGGSALVPLLGGYLVDRFGGLRLLPFHPPLLGLGLTIVCFSDGAVGVALFMALVGMATGFAVPVNNALWAELYGTRYLGEIKSLMTSMAVLATALSPYVLGQLLDAGVPILSLLCAGAVHGFLALFLLVPALGLRRPAASAP